MPSIRLSDLARKLDVELHGNGNVIITTVASIQSAKNGAITFIANPKYRKQLTYCQASAVILTQDDLPFAKGSVLVVKNPYLTYAYIAQIFDTTPQPAQSIASNATIDMSAQLGNNVSIGPNAVIEKNVVLGDNVIIGAGCFIGKRTKINSDTRLWANVTIYHRIEIGKKCLIQSGTIIGADGFGYIKNQDNWIKIPQLGRVVIGDNVKIGACTTIDRGTLDDTIIGNGVIIDNQCHIAHNVIIGDNTAIAGGVVMGGSLQIGNDCMIGGACVINGHIKICDKVKVTGMSMIIRDIVNSGTYSSGIPLQPNRIWRKTVALLMNIYNINKRLRALEHKNIKQN